MAIRTRTEWEQWFHHLFSRLDTLSATTDSEILDYVAIKGPSMGYSVLDFRQTLTVAELTATFDCLATIIWKSTPDGWREAHWHASVISTDIPDGFGTCPGRQRLRRVGPAGTRVASGGAAGEYRTPLIRPFPPPVAVCVTATM